MLSVPIHRSANWVNVHLNGPVVELSPAVSEGVSSNPPWYRYFFSRIVFFSHQNDYVHQWLYIKQGHANVCIIFCDFNRTNREYPQRNGLKRASSAVCARATRENTVSAPLIAAATSTLITWFKKTHFSASLLFKKRTKCQLTGNVFVELVHSCREMF